MSNPSPLALKRKAQLYKSQPPLNDQINNLKKQALNIYKFLDPNDTEYSGNFVETTEAFNENLEKLIHDIWCEYRNAQKANVGEISSKAKKILEEQLVACGTYSTELYDSFDLYLGMIFSDKLLCALSKTILPSTAEFLQIFTDVMLTSITQLLNQAEKTQNEHLIPPLQNQSLNWLKITIEALFKSHENFIQLSTETLNNENRYKPDPKPKLDDEIAQKKPSELTPQEKEKVKKYNLEITEYEQNQSIHNKRFEAQKKAINMLKDFFDNQISVLFDFVLKLYQSLPAIASNEEEEDNEDKGEGNVEKPDDTNYIDLLDNFSVHLEKIEEFYTVFDVQSNISSSYGDEEKKNELNIESFVKETYRNASLKLYKYIIQFWKAASDRKSYDTVIEIGRIAGDYAESELQNEEDGLSSPMIANIAQLYSFAARADDKVTAESLGKMLVVRIQRAEDDLVQKFQEQLELLEKGATEEENESFDGSSFASSQLDPTTTKNTKPKDSKAKDSKAKEQRLKEARSKVTKRLEADPSVAEFTAKCAKIENEIDAIVSDGYAAIFTARTAFDILHPLPESPDEEETPNIFHESLNNFTAALYDQQNNLNRLLESSPPSPSRARDSASVRSSPSKAAKSVRTSATSSALKAASEEARLEMIRNANLNLYEYIILTQRNRLINESRNANIIKTNDSDNSKVQSSFVNGLKEYITHYKKLVTEARNAAAEAMRFDVMEACDERLARIETTPEQLIQSFEEALGDALDLIVENYEVACIHADQEFLLNQEEYEQKLEEMFEEKRKVHLKQIVLLQKKLLIKRFTEEQRTVTAAKDLREEAKKLAAARDYEGARAKQQLAIEVEAQAVAQREEEINAREAKMMKELTDKQKNELALLEQMVERWVARARKESDDVKASARGALEPSMRTAVKRTTDAAIEAISSICRQSPPTAETKGPRKVTPKKGNSKELQGVTRPVLQARFERLVKEKLESLVKKERDVAKEEEKEKKKEEGKKDKK